MSRYEVEISGPIAVVDIRDAPGGVSEPRPYIHLEEVEAVDKDAAEVVGLNAWDKKYGPGHRPDHPDVRITNLDE